MGDIAVAAPGSARGKPAVLDRDPATDDPCHPKPPRPQSARAQGANKFTAKELIFDSIGIVAYGKQSATRFA